MIEIDKRKSPEFIRSEDGLTLAFVLYCVRFQSNQSV